MSLFQKTLPLLGLALLSLGLILHIVGLASPDWTVRSVYNQDITEGLWKVCYASKCSDRTGENAQVKAAAAFAIIGMLLALAGLVAAFLHFLWGLLGKFQNRLLLFGCLAASIAAVASILISVIIWGAGVHDTSLGSLGYSFALCIVGGALVAAGGALYFWRSS